jgi:DNA-binding response OmpR family regulator
MTSPSRSARLPRLAIIDRDSGFVQVVTKRLAAMGWEHRVLATAPPPEELVSLRLGAVLVDLTVVGPRAWEWLGDLSRTAPGLGIVVCTPPSTVAERVRGLRSGADDWVSKPSHPEEVIARIEAVLRRRRTSAAEGRAPLVAGEVEIRRDQFQAFAAGRSLDLTRREFELLELLASADGRVLEREEIYQRVWGYSMAHGDRSVDVFVRKLRQKLERASPGWRYVHTHFGVGYRFAPEAKNAVATARPYPSPLETPAAEPAEIAGRGAVRA